MSDDRKQTAIRDPHHDRRAGLETHVAVLMVMVGGLYGCWDGSSSRVNPRTTAGAA